jgi:hypothetical protein
VHDNAPGRGTAEASATDKTSGVAPSPGWIAEWDVPVRVFHWTLAESVLTAWFSAGKLFHPNGKPKRDPDSGHSLCQAVCAACHGFAGKGRRLGVSSDPAYAGNPLYVGTQANQVCLKQRIALSQKSFCRTS